MQRIQSLFDRAVAVTLPLLLATACGSAAETTGDAAPRPDTGWPERPDGAMYDEPDGDVYGELDAAVSDDPDAAVADAGPRTDASTDPPPDAGVDDPPPIVVSQAGGETSAVAVAGGRIYAGVGPRLTVWDATGGSLVRTGETEPLPGVITGIALAGELAFVTAAGYGDGAVYAIDVSEPTTPTPISSLRLGTGRFSYPAAIAIRGSSAYVADREQGVFAVDIASVDSMRVTGFAPVSGATQVAPVGARVYASVATPVGVGIAVLDASADLGLLGNVLLHGALAVALTPEGLAITRGITGLAVHSLTDPRAPTQVFEAPGVSVWAMVPGDGGAWLTIDGHLRFLDLGDPAAISLGGIEPPVIWAVAAGAIAGDRLAMTTIQGDLWLFGVGDGPARSLGHAITALSASPNATTATGDALVIADTTPGAVAMLNVAQPDDLRPVGRHMTLTADFVDVAYAGGYAYVADWFGALHVFDVSSPAVPAPRASLVTGGNPSSIAIAGNRIYLGESSGVAALRVFSIDDPDAPVEIAAVPGRADDLAIDAGRVYVADSAAGEIRIFDARDPSALALVGTYRECVSPNSVAVSGRLALVACGDGVRIVDVTDPTAPVTRAVWSPPVAPIARAVVAIDGTRGYFGYDTGVTVLDLASPARPIEIAKLSTGWLVRHLAVPYPGRVIAATTRGGVYQWDP